MVDVDEVNSEIFVLAFIMPNSTDETLTRKPLEEYLVSVDEVETAAWLDFFTVLEDSIEDELESAVPTEIWLIEQ